MTDKISKQCLDCKNLVETLAPTKFYTCSKRMSIENTYFACPAFEVKPREEQYVTETPEWQEEVEEIPTILSSKELYEAFGKNKALCEKYAPYLNDAMIGYKITSSARIAAFLATIAIESGRLRYTTELGSDSYFAKYEPTTSIGKALGNTEKGDGARFKGRGLIQITGRANYTRVAVGLGIDCLENPQLLSELPYSVTSACWWWMKNGLNSLADTEDLRAIRKKVNGGLNGYAEFVAVYKRVRQIWK